MSKYCINDKDKDGICGCIKCRHKPIRTDKLDSILKKHYEDGKNEGKLASVMIVESKKYVPVTKKKLNATQIQLLEVQITYLKQSVVALEVIAESLRRGL